LNRKYKNERGIATTCINSEMMLIKKNQIIYDVVTARDIKT